MSGGAAGWAPTGAPTFWNRESAWGRSTTPSTTTSTGAHAGPSDVDGVAGRRMQVGGGLLGNQDAVVGADQGADGAGKLLAVVRGDAQYHCRAGGLGASTGLCDEPGGVGDIRPVAPLGRSVRTARCPERSMVGCRVGLRPASRRSRCGWRGRSSNPGRRPGNCPGRPAGRPRQRYRRRSPASRPRRRRSSPSVQVAIMARCCHRCRDVCRGARRASPSGQVAGRPRRGRGWR